MKVQIVICPWYQTMTVDLPILPEVGMRIELSDTDINRYIAKVKAGDYPEEYGIALAPNTLENDDDGYWQDLYIDTEVVEVNIAWDDEEKAYLPQAVIDTVDEDYDEDDEDYEEYFEEEDEK